MGKHLLNFWLIQLFFNQRLCLTEQQALSFKALAGSTKLLMLLETELFFIPCRFRLKLSIFLLKVFKGFGGDGHGIHVRHYP